MKYSQNWANGHLRIATTSLQRPPTCGPIRTTALMTSGQRLPVNNDHYFWGWLLYKVLTVLEDCLQRRKLYLWKWGAVTVRYKKSLIVHYLCNIVTNSLTKNQEISLSCQWHCKKSSRVSRRQAVRAGVFPSCLDAYPFWATLLSSFWHYFFGLSKLQLELKLGGCQNDKILSCRLSIW